MLNDLKTLMQIPSVSSAPEKDAPFGKECKRVLDAFLSLARNYGFKTGDENGYCGWAEYGDGKEIIGILCHLDVVPAGDGWSYPPYDLTVDNGILYGRGVADDKGAAIVALHTLKRLKENNVKLNRRVRVIVGLNEESGSECMKYYRTHAELPEYSIVPDADFPIINSEKGIAHVKITLPADEFLLQNVTKISSGVRPNVVPDSCKITFKKGSYADEILRKSNGNAVFYSPLIAQKIIASGFMPEDLSVHFFENETVVESRGIAGHAMSPQKAKNAFYAGVFVLDCLKGNSPADTVEFLSTFIADKNAAENLGIASADEVSGVLTVSAGVINYRDGALEITLDLRLPVCAEFDDVITKIKAKLPKNSKTEILSYSPRLYIDSDSPLIKTLLKVYSDYTGDPAKPIAIGGGTYARQLPNSVPFGYCFPNMTTNIHNADECYPLKEFNTLPDIYYNAVLALDKL